MEVWHLIPEDDEKFHKLKIDCWCNPKVDKEDNDEVMFVMHNKGGEFEDQILKNYE